MVVVRSKRVLREEGEGGGSGTGERRSKRKLTTTKNVFFIRGVKVVSTLRLCNFWPSHKQIVATWLFYLLQHLIQLKSSILLYSTMYIQYDSGSEDLIHIQIKSCNYRVLTPVLTSRRSAKTQRIIALGHC